MEKAVGSDSGMSAHIERTVAPKNADPNRTHLNQEMIEFPDGVTNRTEAIQHRLDSAGLQRKIGKKSTDTARLCADDVMSRVRLKEYQNTYAEQMAKYGPKRGIEGSEAKHVTTSQYYRDLLYRSESIQENITALLEKQRTAQSELSKVKADISKEKFKNTAADVGTTVLDGVSSLFGRSKAKQQQQRIETLEAENHNLSGNIKGLNSRINAMKSEHRTALEKQSEQLNKIYNLFPHIKDLLRWENFLKNMGLADSIIRRLFNKEEVKGCTGGLYSKEHSKRFHLENGSLKLNQDKEKPENIRLTVNGTSIYDWFRQKQQEFLHSIGINPPEQKNSRNLKF